jgi:Domain of unknown function (DUF4371)
MMGLDVRAPFQKANAQYVHWDFYSEAIHVIANAVRKQMLASFKVDTSKPIDPEAKVELHSLVRPPLTIIGDECLDVNSHEQLALVLRGVANGRISERFLQLRRLKDKTSESITREVYGGLEDNRIPLSLVQGLGSDGATNWTGVNTGVVVRIQKEVPTLLGIWCHGHRENLMSEGAADDVREIGQYFLDTLQSISLLFDQSGPRTSRLEEVQSFMQEVFGVKLRKIRKRAATRWLSTDDVTETVWDQLPALIGYLIDDSRNPNAADKGKVAGIMKSVGSYKFVFTLAVMRDVMPLLTRTSKVLQTREICHYQASTELKVLREQLLKLKDRGGEHVSGKLQDKIKDVERKVSPQPIVCYFCFARLLWLVSIVHVPIGHLF